MAVHGVQRLWWLFMGVKGCGCSWGSKVVVVVHGIRL